MINKKLKTIISTLIITSLSSNVAFAEMMGLQKPTISTNSNSSTGSKIDIVKDQGSSTTVSFGKIEQPVGEGNSANGNSGVTIAAAYLTPDKKFGYMYVDKYDYNGGGTVLASIDQVNPSNKWGGNVNKGSSTSNNRLFINGINYFTSNSAIANSINNIDPNKVDSYVVQTADDGRKFVATTFYVRYTYDFMDGHNIGTYLRSFPVLGNTTNYTSGPYIAMGDFFDSKIDIIGRGDAGRNLISSNYGKYFTALRSVTTPGLNFNLVGLAYDYHPTKAISGSYVKTNTNKAMLEKRFEYRRYLTTTTSNVTNPGGYEAVYPVTTNTVKTQAIVPDIAPKISIRANTEYSDKYKTEVSRYSFDISISPKKKTNTYAKDLQTYTVRKESDRPLNEPTENKMDLWHTDLVAYLDVVDSSGTSKLYSKKPISLSDTRVYIDLYEIIPDETGQRTLDRCTAKLTVNFRNNARFMVSKELYSYSYNLNGSNKTYNQVIDYINTKPTGLQLKTNIQKYQETTDPREVLTYKTQTSNVLSVEATSGISAVTAGDYANTMVSVDVNPPHTLTVLEGAEFEAIVNIDTGGINIGYDGSDMWISDFMIDSIVITAANGETVYKEENIPISPSPPSSKATEKFSHLTAKPTHIGTANVLVKYSYNLNIQRYHTEWEEYTDENDVVHSYPVTVPDPLETTPQFGSAKNNFNIHSVSGNSVH